MARGRGNQFWSFNWVTENDLLWLNQPDFYRHLLIFKISKRNGNMKNDLPSGNAGSPRMIKSAICFSIHLSHKCILSTVLGVSNAAVNKTGHKIPNFRKHMIHEEFFSSCLPTHPTLPHPFFVCLSHFLICHSLPQFDLQASLT